MQFWLSRSFVIVLLIQDILSFNSLFQFPTHVGISRKFSSLDVKTGRFQISSFRKSNPSVLNRFSFTNQLMLCKKDDKDDGNDDTEKFWIDKLFDPLIDMYSELPESDQSLIASIYQSAYFIVCVYIGIILVRAYKSYIENSASSF